MATANSTGVRPRADHAGRVAPVSALSAASHVRRPARGSMEYCEDCRRSYSGTHQCPRQTTSWLSPAGREALRRAEADTARIRDDEFTRALNERGLAEYNDYVAEAAA